LFALVTSFSDHRGGDLPFDVLMTWLLANEGGEYSAPVHTDSGAGFSRGKMSARNENRAQQLVANYRAEPTTKYVSYIVE
jgi:hypothetical protein